ncbi:MAG: dTDP-4-keto-6-deoxy-D-glucose epimerase [Bacteroidia bacterium]|nr:dTDP-4-keto-6-deoxy-D-glucose epimerase [Bacteroidia bacterium]
MTRMIITHLPLAGLKFITRHRLGDSRGSFSRLFCAEELASAGWTKPIAQINHTITPKIGTVRGMHFQQPPYSEMKLVTCLRGDIFDVAVDLRQGSPTFLSWHGEILSSANNKAMLIPEGFAHGFQTLTDDVELLYCHSAPYAAEFEGGMQPTDSLLGIIWPIPIAMLSKRDSGHPLLTDSFKGIPV